MRTLKIPNKNIILTLACIILVFAAANVFSQMPPEQGGRKPEMGGFGPPPDDAAVIGEVSRVGDKGISIFTQNGDEKEITISSKTSIIRETAIKKSELKKGDNLLVLGQLEENFINANIIVMIHESDKLPPFPSPRLEGGEQGGRPASMPGPVIGAITELEPLTIKVSNNARIIKSTEATRLFKEIPAPLSEIKKGLRVRAIMGPKFGGETREAIKIIIFSEEMAPFKGGQREGPRSKFNDMPKREVSALKFLDSPFGFLMAPPQPGYLFDLDVNWMVTGIRLASWEDIESQKGIYDFSSVDKNLGYLFKNGVNTVIEFRGMNPIYGTPSGRGAALGVSFPERHLSEWARFVERFVERYDGDGIDDAPGSITVKNYQLVHELLLPGLKIEDFWRENPEKYARFFKVTYDAIRRACSDCFLYLAGGFDEDFKLKGEKNLKGEALKDDGFYTRLFMEFQRQGVRFKNIGFDYHYWSFWLFRPGFGPETYRDHLTFINDIKRLYKSFGYTDDYVSVISKESGINSDINSEREQAIYLLKIYVSSIAAGQRHLFWTSVVEYEREAPLFLGMGLVNNPINLDGHFHHKLAYYTYKLMVEKLKDSEWKNVQIVINGENNVYVFKFQQKRNKQPVFIVWWDYFNEMEAKDKRITLKLNLNFNKAVLTSSMPEGENGLELKGIVNFKTEIKEVKSGAISILLGREPVYIEEGMPPQPFYEKRRINPDTIDQIVG